MSRRTINTKRENIIKLLTRLVNFLFFKFRMTGHNRVGTQVEWSDTDTQPHNAPNTAPCSSTVGILNAPVVTTVESSADGSKITGGSVSGRWYRKQLINLHFKRS